MTTTHDIIRAWCASCRMPAPSTGECMALVAALDGVRDRGESAPASVPGTLYADKVQDRSAWNIFAPGYSTAIATVSSQSNANGCMGSLLTRQYALEMAAGPELLEALRSEGEWRAREAVGALDPEWNYEVMVGAKRRAAIAKAEGIACIVRRKPLPPGVLPGQPVNDSGCYYAEDGTFMNADGTRSIFDDVDEDGTEDYRPHDEAECWPDNHGPLSNLPHDA